MGLQKRTVWLDCDPGFDDWLTLLLVCRSQELNCAGVSVVAGNAPLRITLDNALRIRALHGLQVPIYVGCDKPLHTSSAVTAEYVLGKQGMVTLGEPLPSTAQEADGLDGVGALLDHLRSQKAIKAQTTLVAIGPLTNVARALQQDASAMQAVGEIVIMGGSTDSGNHTPAAEFNIFADPEAADIVFRSGIPIRMFGLNVCRQVLLTQSQVQVVKNWPSAEAQMVSGYLDAYQRIRSSDGSQPMPMYDPIVVLWLLAPELFTFQEAPVDIELDGKLTRGMTVCDLRNRAGRASNAIIAMSADGDAVMTLLLKQLKKALAS
jgi:purine nucleosidase